MPATEQSATLKTEATEQLQRSLNQFHKKRITRIFSEKQKETVFSPPCLRLRRHQPPELPGHAKKIHVFADMLTLH